MEASKTPAKSMTNNIFIPPSDTPRETPEQMQSLNQARFHSNKFFIAQETIKISVSSWNIGGISPPDTLNLEELLNKQNGVADIYVFGFQEIVPLNAGNVLRQENKDISMKWNSLIKAALDKSMLPEEERIQKADVGEIQRSYPLKTHRFSSSGAPEYECIINKQMVGIFITIWVRKVLLGYISHPSVSTVGCGVLGCLGNKGSVSVRFFMHETSFCFVCSHLASGNKEGDNRRRNADAEYILTSTLFSNPLQTLPQRILDHDRVIWLGDLNYKIYLPETTTRSLVKNDHWSSLLKHDQLKAEMTQGHVFSGWNEKEIEFAPTYKYYPNSDDYYGSHNETKAKRSKAPAWCDRIIWFGRGLKQIHYNRCESRMSDHRPVCAAFIAHVGFVPLKRPGRLLEDGLCNLSNDYTSE